MIIMVNEVESRTGTSISTKQFLAPPTTDRIRYVELYRKNDTITDNPLSVLPGQPKHSSEGPFLSIREADQW